MFECPLFDSADVRGLSDAGLIDAVTVAARASAVWDALKYSAIAEFRERRRCGLPEGHAHFACDDYAAAAAEIAAALTIGHGRAEGEMDLALALRDKFPRVAALFARGLLTARRVWLIVDRARLVVDAESLEALDGAVTERVIGWGPLSEYKLIQHLDMWIETIDPDAVRRTREQLRDRDFAVGSDRDGSATVPVFGRLSKSDAAIVKQRIENMARAACRFDPRTLKQRRADALGAICAGSFHLACLCGRGDCLAAVDDGRASSVTIHVITDADGLLAGVDPEIHGGPDDDEPTAPPEPDTDTAVDECAAQSAPRRRSAGIVAGHGVIPPVLLAELIARGAKIRYVATALDATPEARYRPSVALDEAVRVRDMTCRAPGCDRPAVGADIDHTIAWPAGPTAGPNLKCYCRIHHLIKTFWPGWADRQGPDGTVVVTTPTGHNYITRPDSQLLWRTAPPPPPGESAPDPPPAPLLDPRRSWKMPKRHRTRDQARADYIRRERALNAQPSEHAPF